MAPVRNLTVIYCTELYRCQTNKHRVFTLGELRDKRGYNSKIRFIKENKISKISKETDTREVQEPKNSLEALGPPDLGTRTGISGGPRSYFGLSCGIVASSFLLYFNFLVI